MGGLIVYEFNPVGRKTMVRLKFESVCHMKKNKRVSLALKVHGKVFNSTKDESIIAEGGSKVFVRWEVDKTDLPYCSPIFLL